MKLPTRGHGVLEHRTPSPQRGGVTTTAAGMSSPTWPVKAQSARVVVSGLP